MLDEKGSWPQMASLTPQADVVIVACSQDAMTQGFVNQAFLSACKPGVIIVNVARGKEHRLDGQPHSASRHCHSDMLPRCPDLQVC